MSTEARIVHHSDKGFIRTVVFLRWMLIILASYLMFFTYLNTPSFEAVVAFALAFGTSNVVFSLMPADYFRRISFQRTVLMLDIAFGCITLYLLRVPGTYVYVAFGLIYLLAAIRRDLKAVGFCSLECCLWCGSPVSTARVLRSAGRSSRPSAGLKTF